MKAKIKEKKYVAKGTLSVAFDLLGQKVNFEPGQFTTVTLINPPHQDSEGDLRYFSINTPPSNQEEIIITTRLRDTAFKNSLKELAIGTEVEIGSIEGSFTLPKETVKPLVFIAGGIGITPFMSMLRYIKDNNLNYKVILIYSNRDKQSTAFLDELEDMAKKNPNFHLIATMTQDQIWSGEKRRIDAKFIKDYIKEISLPVYYIAGPPGLVRAIYKALKDAGVEPSNIKTENFTGYD